MFFKKIKAGSLQLVTGIVALIAILLLMLLLYINVLGKVQQNRESQLAAIHQLDYIDKVLNESKNENEINFNLGIDKSLQISAKPWGIYQLATIKSTYKKASYLTNALIGHYNSISDSLAISLSTFNQPLVLLQDVIIQGDVALGGGFIKPGHVGDFYYNTSNQQDFKLLADTTTQSIIDPIFTNHLSDIFNGGYQQQSVTEKFKPLNEKINSFTNPTLFLYSEEDVIIQEGIFKGNIVIQTPKSIKIGANANLDNIILVCNNLEVMSGFKGNFQAFTKSQIKIHSQVHLTYPSALVLQPDAIVFENKIICEENSLIDGTVAFLSNEHLNNSPHQSIDIKNAFLTGQIYTEDFLSFSGNMEGHIIAEGFIFKNDFRSYINHINKLNINGKNTSKIHLGLPFVNSQKAVLKWVK